MDLITDIILRAGRSAVELSLFVLLPIMVVMLSLIACSKPVACSTGSWPVWRPYCDPPD